MILLMLYLGLCLSTAIVMFIKAMNHGETSATVAGVTVMSFVLAPWVWAFSLWYVFKEACDLCDVRRGLRIHKSHRLGCDWDSIKDW